MYKQQSISAGAIFVLPQALDSYDPKLHGDSLEIYLRDQLQKRISEIVDEDNEWTGNVSLSAPTQGADSDDDLTLEGLIAAQPPQEQSLSTFVELQERLGVVRVQIEEKSAQLNGHIVHGDQKVKSANDLEKFLQERGILDVLNSQDSEYGVYLSGQWGSWAFTRNDDPIEAVIVINQPHDRLEQMTVEISRKLNAQVISNNGTKELKYKDQGREVRLNIISAEASDEEEMDPLLDIFANAVPVHESRRGVIQDIAGGVFHRFGKRAADQIFGYYLFLSERQGGVLKTFEADSTQQGLIDKAQTSQTEDEAMSTVQATDEKDQPVPITLDPDGVLIDIANIGKKYGLQVQFVGGTARRMLWGQNPLNEKVDFDIALWPMEDQVEDTITRVLSFKGAILKEYPNLKLDILNFKGPNLTEDPYELRRSSPEMTINQIIIENTDTGWKVRDMREGQYILDARNRVIRLSNPLVKGQGFSIRTALRYTRLRAEFPEFTATDNEVFNPFVRKGVLGEGSLDVPLTDVFYKFIKGDIETLEKGRQVNYISPFLSIIMHARDPETLPRLLRSMGSEDVNLFSLYEQVIDINQAIQIEQQNRTRGQESKDEDFDKIFKLDTETKRSYRGDRSKAEFANDMHLFIRQHSPSAEFLDLISREEFNAFLKEELYHNLKKPLLTSMGIIAGIGYFVLLETRIMSLLQIKDLIPRWEGYLAGDFLNHLYAHSVEIEKNARSRTNGYGNLWEYYFKVYLKQRDAQTNVMQMPADQPEDWAMDGLEQSALDMMRELDSAAQLKSVVLKLENYYYKEELSEVKEGDLIKIDLTEWYAEYQRQSNKIIFYSSLERSLSRFALALADHFPGHNHFMSKEVLKNAFVHGNKLKLNQPIYISIDPIAGNRFFIVFDTDEVNFDSKEMALAKDAKIYGEGQAKLMIKMMGGVVTKKKIVGGKAVIVTLPPRIDSFRETKTSQPEDQAMQDQDMAMNVKDRRDKELDILLDETDPITVSELWAKLIRIDGYADVTLKMVKHDISRDNRLEKHPKIKKIATPEEVKDRRDEESSILQKTVNPITARELWAELIEVDGYADVTFKMLQHDIESDGRLKKHPKIKKIATPEEVRTRRAKERNILNNQGNAITVNELWNKLKKIKEYADVTLWMVWNDVQNDSSLNKHTLLNKRNLNPDAILVNMGLTKEKVREMTRQDKAQVVGKGGIDFNADKMNLETRNEGGEISAGGGPASGWKFKLDPAMLEQLQNAPGFYPVIINIQPMLNLREFLGIAEVDPSLRSG